MQYISQVFEYLIILGSQTILFLGDFSSSCDGLLLCTIKNI